MGNNRTKALVLGAQPPFEGPRISLWGAEAWSPRVETSPLCDEVDVVTIMVKDYEGKVTPLFPGELIRGVSAWAVARASEKVELVTVHIDAAE